MILCIMSMSGHLGCQPLSLNDKHECLLYLQVASRMESTSIKDHVQCSAPFMGLLQEQWPESAALAVALVCKRAFSAGVQTFTCS